MADSDLAFQFVWDNAPAQPAPQLNPNEVTEVYTVLKRLAARNRMVRDYSDGAEESVRDAHFVRLVARGQVDIWARYCSAHTEHA